MLGQNTTVQSLISPAIIEKRSLCAIFDVVWEGGEIHKVSEIFLSRSRS